MRFHERLNLTPRTLLAFCSLPGTTSSHLRLAVHLCDLLCRGYSIQNLSNGRMAKLVLGSGRARGGGREGGRGAGGQGRGAPVAGSAFPRTSQLTPPAGPTWHQSIACGDWTHQSITVASQLTTLWHQRSTCEDETRPTPSKTWHQRITWGD